MVSQCTVLLAHGSRDRQWRETFEALAGPSLAQWPQARLAFMELCEPSLESVISEAWRNGISSFQVLPLFLAQGRHLRRDVPEMIATLERELRVRITLLPPIGEHPMLGESIRTIISQTIDTSDDNR